MADGPATHAASRLFDLGGTFRTRTPEETLAAIRPHFRHFGITRLANVTGLDSVGIPVWVAIRPAARSLSVSQGKGTSDALAMVSAAMESIELYHGERCVPAGEPHSLAEALRSSAFVDPTQLPLRSDKPFREAHVTAWVEATDVRTGRSLKVPREMLDRDSLVRHRFARLFHSSSNGLASGNTREEAILHGLSEVMERDQAAFWTVFEGLTRPAKSSRLDPDTVDDPVCADLIDRIRSAGLKLAIWHAGEGSAIPAFICSTWDEDRVTPYPTREGGQGAHPYKRVALARALTESVQSRLTHISGSRDDVLWSRYRHNLDVDSAGHALFIAHMKTAPCDVDYRELSEAPPTDDARALLGWLVGRLEEATGGPCLVVDLSDPGLPISVVQVVAPGLDISPQKPLYTPTPRMLAYLERKDLV